MYYFKLFLSLSLLIFTAGYASGNTDVISINNSGELSNLSSGYVPGISSNGQYVVFSSLATNLALVDTDSYYDVYLRNTLTGTTEFVTYSTKGNSANGWSSYPVVNNNGQYIAFYSQATDLIKGDNNNCSDVFRYDTVTQTMTLISQSTGGRIGDSSSQMVSMSNDGNILAFFSDADNLDGSPLRGVFVRDVNNSTTERVSLHPNGSPEFGNIYQHAISGDGNLIAFTTLSDMVPEDSNLYVDVYLRNRSAGTTTLVSGGGSVPHGNGGDYASISENGRYVVYRNGWNIMLRDLTTGTLSNLGSYQPNAFGPYVSNDGKIVFSSPRSDLVPGDQNGVEDVFLLDSITGQVTLVSESTEGLQGNDISSMAMISADGLHIVYVSDASNLRANDTNGVSDIFIRSY